MSASRCCSAWGRTARRPSSRRMVCSQWSASTAAVSSRPSRRRSAEALEERFARLREAFPPPDPVSTHEVTVTFWTYSRHGPMPSWRSIAVPEWNEIAPNYTASTRAALEGLMQGFRPAHGGQLVLWHGEAGTGKTFALRALAWEWRNWCSLHYIVDPDSFFGQHADYLMNVLMQPGPEGMQVVQSRGWSPYGGEVSQFELMASSSPRRTGRWRPRREGLAPARARGHRRAADARREDRDRPGPLPLPQRRRRADRPGPARARARDDERGDPQAPSRRRAARPLRRERRLRAAVARRGLGVAERAGSRGVGLEATTIASLYALAENHSSGPRPSVGFGD